VFSRLFAGRDEHVAVRLGGFLHYAGCVVHSTKRAQALDTGLRLSDSVGYTVTRCYKPEVRGFDSGWCHLNFSLTLFFQPQYGPRVDSASNRNEYQEYFLRVKAAGAWGWQPCHLHVPTVLKSGSFNLLERWGSVQTCNGVSLALPLPFTQLQAFNE
jgi:hypothetical protein